MIDSLLLQAIENGDQAYLNQHAHVFEEHTDDNYYYLIQAAKTQNVQVFDFIYSRMLPYFDLSSMELHKPRFYWSSIFNYSNRHIVDCLLSRTPSLIYKGLSVAISQNDLPMSKYLLEKGASPLAKDGKLTYFDFALLLKHNEIAFCMLDYMNIDGNGDGDDAPLLSACHLGGIEILTELIKRGANVHVRTSQTNLSAFHFAFIKGNVEVISFLKSYFEHKDHLRGFSIACMYGQLHIAELFLSWGFDVNGDKSLVFSPLECAVRFNQVAMIQFLFSRGAYLEESTDIISYLESKNLQAQAGIQQLLLHGGRLPPSTSTSKYSSWYVTMLLYCLQQLGGVGAQVAIYLEIDMLTAALGIEISTSV